MKSSQCIFSWTGESLSLQSVTGTKLSLDLSGLEPLWAGSGMGGKGHGAAKPHLGDPNHAHQQPFHGNSSVTAHGNRELMLFPVISAPKALCAAGVHPACDPWNHQPHASEESFAWGGDSAPRSAHRAPAENELLGFSCHQSTILRHKVEQN